MRVLSERPGEAEVLPPESDEEKLARLLFETMEKLDPTDNGDLGWEGLEDDDRDFYRFCIRSILAYSGRPTAMK